MCQKLLIILQWQRSSIVNFDRQPDTNRSDSPLTRADIERLRSQVDSSARLDLSYQNLQGIDLAYFNLQGANLRGANLQKANLRGTNLSSADLRRASLRGADLDGADLSQANLGDSEQNRADLHQANLSYARLRGLDLRGFDLSGLNMQNADLNGTDLRYARMQGTYLRGADLSTAIMRGPELRGARLYNDEVLAGSLLNRNRRTRTNQFNTPPTPEITAPAQTQLMQVARKTLSDRDAYMLGKHMSIVIYDPVSMRRLFPQGFDFTIVRQFFDAWLSRSGNTYNEQEINAIWIGFAHQLCELYHADRSQKR